MIPSKKTIGDVLDEDPGWLRWAILNVKGFTVSSEIEEEVMRMLKLRGER